MSDIVVTRSAMRRSIAKEPEKGSSVSAERRIKPVVSGREIFAVSFTACE